MRTATPARLTRSRLSSIPYAQAAIEELRFVGRTVRFGRIAVRWPAGRLFIPGRGTRVRGWILMPDGPFDRIHAFLNGREFYTCDPERRPDILEAFPHIANADRAQFNFEIPRRVARHGRIDIVGKRDGQPVGRMSFRFRHDLIDRFPTPPTHLMHRVVDTTDARYFHAHAYKSFGELRHAVARHSAGRPIRRLLDWGCGCGRLAMHWLRRKNIGEVHGCDIDAEAIGWCRTNLPRGRFAVVPFAPPTEYPDNYFDVVSAFSVFTHLTVDNQIAWLAEMQRIMVPGGIFAASVEGPSAAWFKFGPPSEQLLRDGINDSKRELGMEAIVGPDAYRRTYQTLDYTQRVFGQYFEILEYRERGIGNSQDLVVLQKRR